MVYLFVILAILAGGGFGLLAWQMRQRHMARWLGPYVWDTFRRRTPRPGEVVHVLFCVADHFEPRHGGASDSEAWARVEHWVRDYPRLLGSFRDSDGRSPQHTFFYPMEQYEAGHLDALADFCCAGHGEVEVHLHHDSANAQHMRGALVAYRDLLAARHRLLARHRLTGQLAYGFVHGDWALNNSRPDGRCCGVADELTVLRETGCYADFTFPSAPDPTQPEWINRVLYARGAGGRGRLASFVADAGSGPSPADTLLLIQGPLVLDWRRRKWGLLPRVENACLQASQPPDPARLDLWLKARVHVRSRPDWVFVKLHTHGALEENRRVLLGEGMIRLHAELARRAAADPHFRFHYVTAREMYNLARAAEAGWQGPAAGARDFELLWNGATG